MCPPVPSAAWDSSASNEVLAFGGELRRGSRGSQIRYPHHSASGTSASISAEFENDI